MSDTIREKLANFRAICIAEAVRLSFDQGLDGAESRAKMDAAEAAVLALLPQSPEGMGWQPIETAPKDGTPVILGVAGNEYYPRSGWWEDEFERWVVRVSMDGESATGIGIDPTHWMPLPPPPAVSSHSQDMDGHNG